MKWIKIIWTDVKSGENLDVYITIPLAVLVAIWGLIGVPQTTVPYVNSAILIVLSIVLAGILQSRKSNKDLQELVTRLNEAQIGEIQARDYLRNRNDYVSFADLTATAKTIYVMAPTIINIFSQWHSYLYHEKLLKQGAVIQTLFLDPNSPSIESTARCVGEPVENVRQDIERSLSHINWMITQGVSNGSIEARMNAVYPNFSMVLVDPEEQYGRIFVEFKGYGKPLHSRPHIELVRIRDGAWFEYFLEQYQLMWQESQPKYSSVKTPE